ncbi:hypothetical protein [Rhizobium leguminosarum]|uniref:hypothetical protein n=1 Tax=Rhizobium leguminosarum TaxID=384 RepID=UPI0013BC9ECB|nr:hypothetical protein [Rhizobium leguminosarum]NEI60941.1 hypothetical protein [Rhizobium leguminosarum]
MDARRGSERLERLRSIIAVLPKNKIDQVSEAMGIAALVAIESGIADDKAVDLLRTTLGALRDEGVGKDMH